MGVSPTPGCSPSSFSSIVEAGRLFSCQPPSPSLSSSSPSPPTPSLPPPPPSCSLGLLAPWVHGGSHQWLPAAGPRRWSKTKIYPFFPFFIARPKNSYFPPVLVTNLNASIFFWFFSEFEPIWPKFSSILLSDRCVPFFPHHTFSLHFAYLTNVYYLAKSTWLRFCTEIQFIF